MFRVTGALLDAGDEIAGAEGLTAARWQVLGAVVLAQRPLTVPQIARRMGLTRQSVHVTARHLVTAGLAEFIANADHRRSPLLQLTDDGRTRYAALERRQATWANALADGLAPEDLEAAARVLTELGRRIDAPPLLEGGDPHGR
jgi:DNA-binding MarR family transcriptional regulator